MLKLCALLASVFVVAQAVGELNVLHSPDSVKFKGHGHLDQSLLKEVLSAALGFTTHQDSSWPGIRVTNPFHYAEAVAIVVIDGDQKLDSKTGKSFVVNADEEESTTWLALSNRVLKRFPSQNNTLIRIDLSEGNYAIEPYYNVLGDLDNTINSPAQLDTSVAEDYTFVSEVALLNAIATKIESGAISRDGTPDVYWFVVSGLQGLVDFHGEDSDATAEAKTMLLDAIDGINKAFQTAYDGNVLVATLVSDASHIRRTREAKDGPPTPANINVSPGYSEDYAVIFNIILWFSVAFVFAIIATSLAIGTMDPGRDSIIYRMTSNRMKKEN